MTFDPKTGWVPRTAAELLQISQRTFETDNNQGQPLDWDGRDKAAGNLLAANAILLAEHQNGVLQFVVDGLNPANATGFMVDNHLALLGDRRLEGTYSKAEVTISAPIGTSIPVDTALRDNASPRRIWLVDEDYVTTSDPQTIRARAEEKGPVTVLPGQITAFVSSVPGVTIVSNTATLSLGTDEENDDEAKVRRARILRGNGNRTLGAIENAVLTSTDEVTSVYVIENDTSALATIEGLTLPAHSIAVVVFPDTISTEAKEALALAIYTTKAVSVGTNGPESVTINAVSGTKTVNFYFPTEITVDVAVVGVLDASSGLSNATVEAAITAAISTYFAGLRPGQDVRQLDICAILAGIEGLGSLTSVTLNGGAADIAITAAQRAVLGTNTASIP